MPEWSRIARRIRVPLGFILAVAYFWLAHPTWRSLGIAVVVILPGLAIRALASGHVRKNEALATSGPYAYTRNPLYLGSLLMGIGFAIAARSWWIFLALILMFFAIYMPVIRDEEKFLRTQFPDFDQYARHVPRMVPRLTAYSGGERNPPEFSISLYQKHREYNALLGVLLMIAAVIVKMELNR